MSEPPEVTFEESAAPCSDMGNAQVMSRWYGSVARWVPAWQKWYSWDEGRGLWTLDNGAMHYAQQTAIGLYHMALERAEAAETELRGLQARFKAAAPEVKVAKERHAAASARVRWYVRSQMFERTRAILNHASNLPEFRADPTDFDSSPHLLGTPSGTVNLWAGEVRAPAKRDLITKSTKVSYVPGARCPAWDAFLHQVMCGDAELVSYLQRIAGYCLTGSTEEHFLGFFYGDGANGKSTFLSILAEAVGGDYYCQAPRGLLFWHRFEPHPAEIASLFGKRYVVCSEVAEGARLDEAKVKDLTGGDRISARRMREDPWDFSPTHKLLIAGNHWFFVRGQDEGIWRRIHVVPWNLRLAPEEIDTTIMSRLRAELPGILTWAVRGAVEWRKKGLAEPASCASIRDKFRSDSDLFTQFLTDNTTLEGEGRVPCDTLYDTYLDWMREKGHAVVLGRRKFSARLRDLGADVSTVRRDGKVVSGWFGIRLASAEERASRRWGV